VKEVAMALPEVVSREDWLKARLRLLGYEKRDTRRRDALNTERRRLPMVRIEKEYVFDGPQGPVALAVLFGDSKQLIVEHIVFGPDWDAACPSCTNFIDELSDGLLAHLRARDSAFALVSRTPMAKIEAYRTEQGWVVPWYSSYGRDFNFDFQVSLDQSVRQVDYNYRPAPQLLGGEQFTEMPGTSCFLRAGEEVFHAYSTYGRGNEYIPLHDARSDRARQKGRVGGAPKAAPPSCTAHSRRSRRCADCYAKG